MIRAVLLSSHAARDLAGIDRRERARVRDGLLRFASSGRGDLKKLKGVSGGPDLFRLRVGEHRVVFELTPTAIRVTRILPRSAGYAWL